VLDKGLAGPQILTQVVTCIIFVNLIQYGVTANPLANGAPK